MNTKELQRRMEKQGGETSLKARNAIKSVAD